jgi:hypothetical protein
MLIAARSCTGFFRPRTEILSILHYNRGKGGNMSEEEFEAIIEEVLGPGPEERTRKKGRKAGEAEKHRADERESGSNTGGGGQPHASGLFNREGRRSGLRS